MCNIQKDIYLHLTSHTCMSPRDCKRGKSSLVPTPHEKGFRVTTSRNSPPPHQYPLRGAARLAQVGVRHACASMYVIIQPRPSPSPSLFLLALSALSRLYWA